MKIVKLLLALLASGALCTGAARALTADELAAYLGVSAWRTTVELPPESLSFEIYEFAAGVVAGAPVITVSNFAQLTDTGLTIMAGSQNGKYRFMLICSGGAYGAPTEEPVFGSHASYPLPEKIKEGDFVLFGTQADVKSFSGQNKDLHNYSKGFLLRIKKRS